MISDSFFIFHMHNPFGKPLSLACGVQGHQCFTNTSCLIYVLLVPKMLHTKFEKNWIGGNNKKK